MTYTQTYTVQHISEHLSALLSSERFLRSQIPGNGLPIYVCAYPVSIHNEMAHLPDQLVNFLRPKGISALHLNLYHEVIAELQTNNLLTTLVEREANITKHQLRQMLNNRLDATKYLLPRIKRHIEAHTPPPQLVFIDGLAAVYPFVRAHTILNHLELVTTTTPVVVFLPGQYRSSNRGMTLSLFGSIHDDNYYRAINIMEVK